MALPRVLLLNERDPSHPLAGGAEIHVAEIFQRLAASGYEVTQLSCRPRGASAREVIGGVDVRRLGRIRAYYPRVAWTCARETAAGRYEDATRRLRRATVRAPRMRSPHLALAEAALKLRFENGRLKEFGYHAIVLGQAL